MKNITLSTAFRCIKGVTVTTLTAVLLLGTVSCSHKLTQNLSGHRPSQASTNYAFSCGIIGPEMTVESVSSWLKYVKTHPKKEKLIVQNLSTPSLYEKCSYLELCDLSTLAHSYGYDELSLFFDELIMDREDSVISAVGEMSISEAAAYYRTNMYEMPFLDSFFSESLLPELTSSPYRTVRHIRDLFSETNLSPDIDAIYWPLRDSVVMAACQELTVIQTQEDDYLQYLQERISSAMSDYVDSALVLILDKGMQRVEENMFRQCLRIKAENKQKSDAEKENYIKTKEESVKEFCTYFHNLCSDYLNTDSVRDTLARYYGMFTASGDTVRREYLSFWTGLDEIHAPLSMPDISPFLSNSADMSVSMANIRTIAAEKFSSRIQDAVWNAVGFIPIIGDILTIPDIVWNIYRGKKTDRKNNELLQSFCATLREEAIKCYSSVIEEVSARYEKDLNSNYTTIQEYVNENI